MPCELCRDDGITLPCGYCSSSVAFRAAPKERTRQQLREEADERMAAAAAKIAPVNPPRQLPEAVLAGSTAPKEESEWSSRSATSAPTASHAEPDALRANSKPADSQPTSSGDARIAAASDADNALDRGGVSASGSTARRQRRRAPKATKRTSEQVTRAAEQSERTRQGRAFWTELGTVLEGNDAELDDFVASLRDAELLGD